MNKKTEEEKAYMKIENYIFQPAGCVLKQSKRTPGLIIKRCGRFYEIQKNGSEKRVG